MPDVAHQLQDRHGQVAEKNMEKVKAILVIIIFCGNQNNEAWNTESTEQTAGEGNPGNFLALMKFRHEMGMIRP